MQGVAVLHLRGEPAERGRQQGALLRKQFRVLRERYLERFVREGAQRTAARLAAMGFQQFMPPEYVAEMKALAAAAGEDYVGVLLANTFLDSSRALFCSVVIAGGEASRSGRLLFARNNDFPTFGVAHKASMLIVTHHTQPGRHSFVSIGWPGVVGVVSGMNDAGLCLATLVSLSRKGVSPGMPYCMMLRQILETCDTPQQALALVKRTRRTSANNLAVAAPKGQPLVIEYSSDKVVARRPVRGLLLATNHFRSKQHVPVPKPIDNRFATLQALTQRHRGSIDVPMLKRTLHAVNQGEMTMQSMIFEPTTRRIHLSVGTLPSTAGNYVTFDCTRLFGAK